MKGVLGLSLKDIMEMDVKKLHEVVKEKYLDYSESRGTYASSASGKTFDKSMWARSWAYEMDGNGFRAKAIDCSKREMRRVWDANPYDGWCP